VPNHQRLKGGVIFIDEFPLTITGKIMKRKLKEIVSQIEKSSSN
jgi:acyl-coenzyme A synthetase/AMP-(fatty) acid ligase